MSDTYNYGKGVRHHVLFGFLPWLSIYEGRRISLQTELGFGLHATGSYYFGYEGGDDFDFFVSELDVPDARAKLIAKGFHEHVSDDYDPDPEEWINYRRDDVDVEVLRKETAATVEAIQQKITKLFGAEEFGKFCKKDRRRIYYLVRRWPR